jgi:rhodanese-related sulfurtransferase
MDMKVSSTVAYERAHNELLGLEAEDEFVRRALASLGPQPPNFKAIVELNRGGETADRPDARPLTPRQVELKRAEGALIVDVRTDLQFDDAHVGGAIAITALRAGFGSKLAWLADREQEVVLVGRDDADALHAAHLAAAVGITRFGGYLAGGMTSWREDRRPVEHIERVPLDDLHARWEADRDGVQVLDVRERDEWDAGHIPGSAFTPYHDLTGIPDGLDGDGVIAVVCASGQRAAVGASLLQRHGAAAVWHVVEGGVPRWERQGWPTVRP